MRTRSPNSDNLDLIGHTYHAPGSIALFAVEDVGEREGIMCVVNVHSGARATAEANDVRRFLKKEIER